MIKPKVLAFDAYGTLFDIFSIGEQLRSIFGDKANEINQLWRKKQLEYTWLRALMGKYKPFYRVTVEALAYACDFHGEKINEEQIKSVMEVYSELKVYPDVIPSLDVLKKDFQLCILSNADPEMLESASKYNQIDRYFQQMISVDILKTYKPSPGVYQLPEKLFNVNKEEVAFISTNTWDISGASAYGLQTIWLNRFNGNPETMGYEFNVSISCLSKLEPLLER